MIGMFLVDTEKKLLYYGVYYLPCIMGKSGVYSASILSKLI